MRNVLQHLGKLSVDSEETFAGNRLNRKCLLVLRREEKKCMGKKKRKKTVSLKK